MKVIGDSSISCLRFQTGIPQALCNFLHIHQVLSIIIILLEWGISSDEKPYHGKSLLLQCFIRFQLVFYKTAEFKASWLQQSPERL